MSATTSDIAAGRRLKVEIEIDVVELSEAEMDECRSHLGDLDGDEPDGFSPYDYSAREVADVIEGGFHEESVREMFAGSDIYVTFANARVVGAQWITAPSQIEEG